MSRNRRPSLAKTFMALLSYVLAAMAIVMAMNLVSAGETGQALLGASLGVFLIVAARKGSR